MIVKQDGHGRDVPVIFFNSKQMKGYDNGTD
jgi:hypothetical protein